MSSLYHGCTEDAGDTGFSIFGLLCFLPKDCSLTVEYLFLKDSFFFCAVQVRLKLRAVGASVAVRKRHSPVHSVPESQV